MHLISYLDVIFHTTINKNIYFKIIRAFFLYAYVYVFGVSMCFHQELMKNSNHKPLSGDNLNVLLFPHHKYYNMEYLVFSKHSI